MKSKTQQISITIERKEALNLINTLRKGLGSNEHFNQTIETEPARKLLKLLSANFINSVTGIHNV